MSDIDMRFDGIFLLAALALGAAIYLLAAMVAATADLFRGFESWTGWGRCSQSRSYGSRHSRPVWGAFYLLDRQRHRALWDRLARSDDHTLGDAVRSRMLGANQVTFGNLMRRSLERHVGAGMRSSRSRFGRPK
jgi:hypothetical protein